MLASIPPIKSKGHSLLPEQIFKENVPFASFVSGPLSHPEQTWGADSGGSDCRGLFPYLLRQLWYLLVQMLQLLLLCGLGSAAAVVLC